MDTKSQSTRTILVTGASGPAGRALGAQFAQRESSALRVIGADMAPSPTAGFERIEKVPAAADPDYDSATLDLVSSLGADLVIPTVSDGLPRLAVLGLAAGFTDRLVLSAPGPVTVAGDKLLTMWALARHGVPVPAHRPADAFASAAEALAWAGGPVVVKPRVSRGGRNVHVVTDGADPVWERVDARWIVQGFAPGAEFCPQVYRSPVTGRTTVVVLRKTGFEHGEIGNATAVERVPDGHEADVADVAARAVEALGLHGPVDLDVRRLPDGTPVVLEVNARFGAVSAAAPELLDHVLDEWLG